MITKVWISIKILIKRLAEWCISIVANILKLNLLDLAFRENGIWYWSSYDDSGERYVLKTVLSRVVVSGQKVIFDVGANVGTYTKMVHQEFPNSRIHCFEPHPETYKELKKNTGRLSGVTVNNFGLSDSGKMISLYSDAMLSGLTTAFKEVYKPLHDISEVSEVKVKVVTLDSYCEKNLIDKIDLLKIDVEGLGIPVLMGGSSMIMKGLIDIIQFEFNEINIFSKTFLKDYFDLLPDHLFYRIKKDGLVALSPYSPKNEIHYSQNIIAVHRRFFGSL